MATKNPRKSVKSSATRKQLLLVTASGDGPWCGVSYVRGVEVLGASMETVIRILVRDGSRRTPRFAYTHRGPGMKILNVPRGELKVRRIKGTEPITVLAYCGP